MSAGQLGAQQGAQPRSRAATLRPYEAMEGNLAEIVALLERQGVEYWLLRADDWRYRLAVPESARAAVVAALNQGKGLRADAVARGQVIGSVLRSGVAGRSSLTRAEWLRVYRVRPSGSPAWKYGASEGIDVEFWREDGSVLVGPRPTLIGATIHTNTRQASLTVGDRPYRTFDPFTRHLPADITFPIDAVYTWVDGGDPRWRARRNEILVRHGLAPDPLVHGAARFRDRDELRYSLRALDMFAPWIRYIFLITDDQRPAWLDEANDRVRVVDHREILAGHATLPTYNSAAIETGLHRIDGLAEHFIYFNDDVMLGTPVTPGLFFAANGQSRFFPSSTAVPFGPPDDSEAHSMSAARNLRELLDAEFGWTLTHLVKHTPHPLRRSVLAQVSERFATHIVATAGRQFRSRSDIAIAPLHHWYGMLTGQCLEGLIRNAYINTAAEVGVTALADLLATRRVQSICLNDTEQGTLGEVEQATLLSSFLAQYFPVRAAAERADRPPTSPGKRFLVPLPRHPHAAAQRRDLDLVDPKRTAVQRQIRRGGLGSYEAPTMATLLALTEGAQRGFFFDIGAHIGLYSALVAALTSTPVLAFEPNPETAKMAAEIRDRNQLSYDVVAQAIAATSGSARLYLSAKTESSDSLNPKFREHAGTVEVSTSTVDEVCRERGILPAVLKIDTETFEPQVLLGAAETIVSARPWIVCEVIRDLPALRERLVDLSGLGYRFYRLTDELAFEPVPPAQVRPGESDRRDWLLAPSDVSEEFVQSARAWLASIVECDRSRNVEVATDPALVLKPARAAAVRQRPWHSARPGLPRVALAVLPPIIAEALRDARRNRPGK